MSTDSIGLAKAALRRDVLQRLKGMSMQDMQSESESGSVAVYVDCERLREVQTESIVTAALKSCARVYVPRVLDRDSNMHFLRLQGLEELVQVPPFGIREPPLTDAAGAPRSDALQSPDPLQLIIMPGLAFDESGRRLGRGGGYYDKFITSIRQRSLERSWKTPLLVALAFNAQMVDSIPVGHHDVPVDVIVTPRGPILCTRRGEEEWP
ncbi:5-formyltetrahydrofolate cyclo-ligase [Auxenochlorella protothecoides]|uniref:5-formyltetrahydrofolate cyclo-ligase n=1 Tax=Auxenochlorella protothecoides TaxID=3075 RepID=A0A087SGD6_AUXPR|nr:5-formyltetrahydrofolate cyclo-ligase [Auxenochlorella protothecoides]KFM24790.1 5-formyltetrahydrofolate cyclo-ligase [Auxenochlorella protothecoides]